MVMILHSSFLACYDPTLKFFGLGRVMKIKYSCSWSGRLHPSFFGLGRVDGEVSQKNDTVPCPKPKNLDGSDLP